MEVDAARLVFLDEAGAKTNMMRLRGRAPRGVRLDAKAPHGHWKTTTMISSVRVDGTTACMTIEGATNTLVFREYVRHFLCPSLRAGNVVILDNLVPHTSAEMEEIERLCAAVQVLKGSHRYRAENDGERKTPDRATDAAIWFYLPRWVITQPGGARFPALVVNPEILCRA